MGTNVNEGLGNRNSIRISLGKSVRWVNDEGGWEIGRVVLADGEHLVDGYFGGMRTHYMVQGYHGGLFFVKDSILEDAPARDTYEDKDGKPLAIPKEENGPSVGPIEPYWPKESWVEEQEARVALQTKAKPIVLATWPTLVDSKQNTRGPFSKLLEEDKSSCEAKEPSEYPNGHQRIMESSAAYEEAKQEIRDTLVAERTIPSWVVEEYNKRHIPPSNKAEEYSKEHKRARQACNSVEQAATLDCRKGSSIQFYHGILDRPVC